MSNPDAEVAAVPKATIRWCIVELNPAPIDSAGHILAPEGWDIQRVVLVRDTLEDAQRVLGVLYETSLGDEVFAIQGRLVT